MLALVGQIIGGGGVVAVFDKSVLTSSGTDSSFTDTATGGTISWVGGSGNVQPGSFISGGAIGNGWQWSPGGGFVVPDTDGIQSGTIV